MSCPRHPDLDGRNRSFPQISETFSLKPKEEKWKAVPTRVRPTFSYHLTIGQGHSHADVMKSKIFWFLLIISSISIVEIACKGTVSVGGGGYKGGASGTGAGKGETLGDLLKSNKLWKRCLGYFFCVFIAFCAGYTGYRCLRSIFCCKPFYPGTPKCYVCDAYLSRNDEFSRRARRLECLVKNSETVAAFPAHPLAKCPHCNSSLRLIDRKKSRKYEFTCDNDDCVEGRGICGKKKHLKTKTDNRYNCLRCDYDNCAKCVQILTETYENTLQDWRRNYYAQQRQQPQDYNEYYYHDKRY